MSTPKQGSVLSSPLLWMGLLIGGAALAAVLLSLRDDPVVSAGIETSPVVVEGAALPPLAQPDPAIGLTVPSFEANTFDGDRVTISNDGTPRVIGFFAHWCPHCQEEVPQVVDWLAAGDLPSGVDVVAVSTSVRDDAANYPPSAWFAREEWVGPVVIDSDASEIAQGFGLTAFPYWVAVDRSGAVVARTSGQIGEAGFRALIDASANG